jgi:prefoldin beta subunit
MTEKDHSDIIQEMQMLEQNLNALLYQRQTNQTELNEVENALNEVEKSKEDPYKIASGIMVKVPKEDIKKELEEKKNVLSLRNQSIEKQEKLFEKRSEELRKELQKQEDKKPDKQKS